MQRKLREYKEEVLKSFGQESLGGKPKLSKLESEVSTAKETQQPREKSMSRTRESHLKSWGLEGHHGLDSILKPRLSKIEMEKLEMKRK